MFSTFKNIMNKTQNNDENNQNYFVLFEQLLSQMECWDDVMHDSPGKWVTLSTNANTNSCSTYFSKMFFDEIRNESRNLYFNNCYAINAIENRVSYVVGKGHKYHVIPNIDKYIDMAKKAQEILDSFIEQNHWFNRQQEIMRRKDRDGEVFLRFFCDSNGETTIRFVEPEQIKTPNNIQLTYATDHGIKTKNNDIETVLGYWINDEYIESYKIQHRKSFVDNVIKRGVPILYPVRKNLVRAEKLLRNMSVVAEVQSAIALIRKHSGSNSESIQKFLMQKNDKFNNGRHDCMQQKFQPGTIIDAQAGIDYEFPIAAIDASRYIQILQAELRAIASRLVMPEFMLTSDASNANYSSTMIAEGPAVRMFERLQEDMIHDDLEIMKIAIDNAKYAGLLPSNISDCVKIQVVPPSLAVRDRYNETKADEILLNHGIISPQTMALRYGLNPEKEAWLHCHCHDSNQNNCDCNK